MESSNNTEILDPSKTAEGLQNSQSNEKQKVENSTIAEIQGNPESPCAPLERNLCTTLNGSVQISGCINDDGSITFTTYKEVTPIEILGLCCIEAIALSKERNAIKGPSSEGVEKNECVSSNPLCQGINKESVVLRGQEPELEEEHVVQGNDLEQNEPLDLSMRKSQPEQVQQCSTVSEEECKGPTTATHTSPIESPHAKEFENSIILDQKIPIFTETSGSSNILIKDSAEGLAVHTPRVDQASSSLRCTNSTDSLLSKASSSLSLKIVSPLFGQPEELDPIESPHTKDFENSIILDQKIPICTETSGTSNILIKDSAEGLAVHTPHAEQASSSLRRTNSTETLLSEASSSLSLKIVSPLCSQPEELNRDDSSSPVIPLKKRKRDISKDNDREEELDSDAPAEKMVGLVNLKKKYKHLTHVSEGEPEEPQIKDATESRQSKYGPLYSDFELMMQKKNKERARARKRSSGSFVTSNDEYIAQLIDAMDDAAYEDRLLHRKGQPATKKIALLKFVLSQLRKKDLQPIYLEHNILSSMNEWLTPLPSKYLPCIQIREGLLRVLEDFPRIEACLIRLSGLGRTLKLLIDHPDETKDNKKRCSSLLEKWSRPIDDSTSDYRAMTKRERQKRDHELSLRYAQKKAERSISNREPPVQLKPLDIALASQSKTKPPSRPGQPGWVPRARVPQPSMRDYINRPVSKVDNVIITKQKPTRLELLTKKYQKAMREKEYPRSAVKLSIVGDKM